MTPRIKLFPPQPDGSGIAVPSERHPEQMLSTDEATKTFEQELAGYVGEGKHIVALNSGTTAFFFALRMLGVQPDDRVICPTLSSLSLINPILAMGAVPVFVDCETETWNMSPEYLTEAIKACIHAGKKPKAIVFANLYGMPAQVSELLSVAWQYEIPVVENAADAIGATYYDQKCGTFGAFGFYSFGRNKLVSTIKGGALVCPSQEIAEKARSMATLAGGLMGDTYAESGRSQLAMLDSRIQTRRGNYLFYREAFNGLSGIDIRTEPCEQIRSNHRYTCILVDTVRSNGVSRDYIQLKMWEAGIETRPLWKPAHQQPAFREYAFFGNGNAEYISTRGLCLPVGFLREDALEEIVLKLAECCLLL